MCVLKQPSFFDRFVREFVPGIFLVFPRNLGGGGGEKRPDGNANEELSPQVCGNAVNGPVEEKNM